MAEENVGQMDPAKVDFTADEASVEAGHDTNEKKPLKQRVLAIIWDSLDKPPKERKLIKKIDMFVMTYVCVAYFVKYLDKGNIAYTYVSGMKEDLHMEGNEYTMLNTMFTIGYAIGNLPSQIIMTRIRPSIWLPACELLWGFLVMGMAGAKDVKTLYVLRFFVGLLEASSYPGTLTLLGNWYTPQELGKRSVIFICSSSLAQMFGGYLQAGLYAGMDGRLGLRAWQWLFIFDGIIGTPVALCGFFVVPDSPATTRAWWLKQDDRELALERMERVGRKRPKKLTWATFRDIFTSWPVYVFAPMFTGQLLGIRVYDYFSIWIKSTGRYTVEQVNTLTTVGYAYQVVTGVIWAWMSDAVGHRGYVLGAAACTALIGTIILSIYPEHNNAAMMAGWILTFGETGASVLIFTWINELLSFSAEQRAVVIGIVEAFGFAMSAWIILFAYNSGEAPHFSVGYEMATMFFCIQILGVLAATYFAKKKPPGPTGFVRG